MLFLDWGAGVGAQREPSGLTELRRQRSEFEEIKVKSKL